MSIHEVKIPDIGDAEDVEVIEICVQPGDVVEADDALIVIESDKASMELPAPLAGTVQAIAVTLGDQVNAGDVVLSLEIGADDERVPAEPAAPAAEAPARSPAAASAPAAAETASIIEPTADTRPVEPAGDGADEAPLARAEPTLGSRLVEVRVPDIGDAKDVVVIEVAVAVGGQVAENDLLVVVESDKASMEIPSPYAGVIQTLAVAEGDSVDEDSLLVVIETDAAVETEPRPPTDVDAASVELSGQEEAVTSNVAESPGAAPAQPDSTLSTEGESTLTDAADSAPSASVYAGPAVRRLARELGVDLTRVTGSGARGRIVKDDVKAFVKTALTQGTGAADGGALPSVPLVDFSRFGEIETVPLTRLRARGAANLHASWLNVVHVTQHDEADVTDLESFRKSLAGEGEARGTKLTPLPFIMKVCQRVLQEHPNLNASLDPGVENLIRKRYYNIGFAVDTDEGLIVPVVRDVDQKGIWTLAEEIAELSELARGRRLKPEHIQGGCFTISSLGSIGGTGFTPIVNAPEVAILGVARLATKPVWDGSEFRPRSILPLSLSYDHRAVNGAEAGRFVVALCSALGDIRRLAL